MELTTTMDYTKKSWTHPTPSFLCFTPEIKKVKSWIHPAFPFSLITPGAQTLTHPLSRQGNAYRISQAADHDIWMAVVVVYFP